MTIDEMLAGDWKLLIEEMSADEAETLTFDAGRVLKDAEQVGTYSVGADVVTVTQGSTTITFKMPDLSPVLPGIEPAPINFLQANASFAIPDDEPLDMCASLARVTMDKLSEDEVKSRLAA